MVYCIGITETLRLKGESPRHLNDIDKTVPSSIDAVRSELTQITGVDTDCRIIGGSVNNILIMSIDRGSLEDPRKLSDDLLSSTNLEYFNIFLIYDHGIELSDNSLILWKLFNNVDPIRDIYIEGNRAVINACKKGVADQYDREWPDEIVMSREVVKRVEDMGISMQ